MSILCILGSEIIHAQAYGRVAFSIPFSQQPLIKKKIQESGNKILVDLVTLDTPGKASVTVIILSDPVSIHFVKKLIVVLNNIFSLQVILLYANKYNFL